MLCKIIKMPRGKYARKPRGGYKKKAYAPPRGIGSIRRRMMFNPQPVFTETYKATTLTFGSPSPIAGTGFLLTANMDGLSQLTQYSNLYTKYKILSAKFILLPNFAGGTDQNAALYNLSQGTMSVSSMRIIYAYENSPAATGPVSEQDALEENGCKIKILKDKLSIPCVPTPNTKDANGVEMTLKNNYINFATSGPNITHYGVKGWLKQLFNNQPQFLNDVDVYVKLTFQLSDPR